MDARWKRFIGSGWALLIEVAALQMAPLFAIWALVIPFLVSSDCGREHPGCSPTTNSRIALLFGLAALCLALALAILVARSVAGGRARSSATAGWVGSVVGWTCLVLLPSPDAMGALLVAIVLGGLAGGAVLRWSDPTRSRRT